MIKIPRSAIVSPAKLRISEWDIDDERCTMKTHSRDAGVEVYLVRVDAVEVT